MLGLRLQLEGFRHVSKEVTQMPWAILLGLIISFDVAPFTACQKGPLALLDDCLLYPGSMINVSRASARMQWTVGVPETLIRRHLLSFSKKSAL